MRHWVHLIWTALFVVLATAFAQVAPAAGAAADSRITLLTRTGSDQWSGVVGIESVFEDPKTHRKSVAFGTGFLVAPCRVMTAAHVVVDSSGTAVSIRVGMGPRPRGVAEASANPQSVDAHFTTVVSAHPLFYGGTTNIGGSFAVWNMLIRDFGEEWQQTGQSIAGDWALLEVSPCQSNFPTYSLPKGPFPDQYHASAGTQYKHALGYPGGRFAKVTDTKCLIDYIRSSGTRVECPLFPGNSGGPLLDSPNDRTVSALLSGGNSITANLIPTMAPGALVALGLTSQPEPGCIAKLKQAMQIRADAAGLKLDFRPFDNTPTPQAMAHYLFLTNFIAFKTNSIASTIVPAQPDAIWCSAILEHVMADRPAPSKLQAFAGAWRRPNYRGQGVSVAVAKGTLSTKLLGDKVRPALKGNIDLGWRIHVAGIVQIDKDQSEDVRWTLEFRPNRPPLLVGIQRGDIHYPIFEQLEKGQPTSGCAEDRAELLPDKDDADYADDVLEYDGKVMQRRCPGPTLKALPEADPSSLAAMPPLVVDATDQIGCAPAALRPTGTGRWEIACYNRVGGIVVMGAKGGTFDDCLALRDGMGTGSLAQARCSLPANSRPEETLTRMMRDIGKSLWRNIDCTVVAARSAGAAAYSRNYEVKCANGTGYILSLAPERLGGALDIRPCGSAVITCSLPLAPSAQTPGGAAVNRAPSNGAATSPRPAPPIAPPPSVAAAKAQKGWRSIPWGSSLEQVMTRLNGEGRIASVGMPSGPKKRTVDAKGLLLGMAVDESYYFKEGRLEQVSLRSDQSRCPKIIEGLSARYPHSREDIEPTTEIYFGALETRLLWTDVANELAYTATVETETGACDGWVFVRKADLSKRPAK